MLAVEGRARGRARRRATSRALRRGATIAVLVAALAMLRAVDGLTFVTGGFVVLGFLLAELVLTAPRATRSG
jgi:hypothetical protein